MTTYTLLVNWKGWRDTIACLRSLLATQADDQAIVICDNASPDASIPELRAWLDANLAPDAATVPGPRVRRAWRWRHGREDGGTTAVTLLEGRDNYGFAGGMNVALDVALADGAAEFVFFLNNDTEVLPSTIGEAETKLRTRPDLALCGVTLVHHGREDVVQSIGGGFNPFVARPFQFHRDRPFNALPDEREIEPKLGYLNGAAIFARASLMRRLGGLEEGYFLYYEELDLAQRLLPGEGMGWARRAIVRHKVGGSIGTATMQARASDLSLYYDYRSKTRFMLRHRRRYLPFLLSDLARTSLAYLRRGDRRAVSVILSGVRDHLLDRPSPWRPAGRIAPDAE